MTIQLSDSISYTTLHAWLRAHYPKTGICDHCQRRKLTEYAVIHGRGTKTYKLFDRLMWGSRDKDDYLELCKSCHAKYDNRVALVAREVLSPEHRARIGAAFRGQPKSPEHRRKIAESVRRTKRERRQRVDPATA